MLHGNSTNDQSSRLANKIDGIEMKNGRQAKVHGDVEAAAGRVAPIAAGISAKSGECHCCLRRPLAPPALRRPDFISYESMPGSDIDLQRTTRRSFSLDDVGWRFARVPTNDTDILEPSASWLSTSAIT
jgi:hypothetical protein